MIVTTIIIIIVIIIITIIIIIIITICNIIDIVLIDMLFQQGLVLKSGFVKFLGDFINFAFDFV